MTARRKAYLLALAVWPLFLVSAVTLGAFREKVIATSFSEQAAHVIGTLLFIAAMLAIMWVFACGHEVFQKRLLTSICGRRNSRLRMDCANGFTTIPINMMSSLTDTDLNSTNPSTKSSECF